MNLDAERTRLLDRLTELPTFDPQEIQRAAEARVLELREALEHGPESRTALRSLLGNRRLRVGPDPERGFRVDGLLEVELETRTARAEAPEPFDCVVAGGRYVYVTPARIRCVAWPGGARVVPIAA